MMATLIAVYNCDGCVGRCDYDAKCPDCDPELGEIRMAKEDVQLELDFAGGARC